MVYGTITVQRNNTNELPTWVENANELPKWVRPKVAAKYGGVSIASIWNYAKQGLLHPIKVTRGVTVFDRDEIEAFFSGSNSEVA